LKNKFSAYTAAALVIANMVGTGVFTSLGFQVVNISSGFALILLWFIGGIIALLGALCYSEIGVIMPRSGGEYHYLSKIYHPALGFLAGWISFLVGFAAPVAAASIAFGNYLYNSFHLLPHLIPSFFFISAPSLLGITIVIILTVIHSTNKMWGASFQNSITFIEVIIIFVLIALGLRHGPSAPISFIFDTSALHDILSPAFAVSMFFITYSYSGWNASAYVAGEIENPSKNIPLSLITGTSIVIILYILLNFVFLYTVPINQLSGKVEIGLIYANKILGAHGGGLMGSAIAIVLISTISSMIITGPRVSKVIGEDYHLFRWLSRKNSKDVPTTAIVTQSIISIVYIATSTFEQVIIFIGFTLNLFTFLTVLGVIILRIKHPEIPRPYKTFGYPIIPGMFLLINIWIIMYGLMYKPHESLVGISLLGIGLVIYFIDKHIKSWLTIT
jgi:basic amino acid/polyamine antiporter, APA family